MDNITDSILEQVDIFVSDEAVKNSEVGSKSLEEVKQAVRTGNARLEQVVTLMEPYLTSTTDSIRKRGVKMIVELLVSIATGESEGKEKGKKNATVVVGKQEAAFAAFFISKIADYACVREGLEGLLVTIKSGNFPKEETKSAVECILSKITVQSLPQSSRHTALEILREFTKIKGCCAVLLSLGSFFPKGFTDVMDGEKDPRCLTLCFDIVAFIGEHFDESSLKEAAEDLFDVTACYFPITFKPPKNDPYRITTEDMKRGLSRALSSSQLFCKYVVELVSETVQEGAAGRSKEEEEEGSSSSSSKSIYDALDLLGDCISAYNTRALTTELPTLRRFFSELFITSILSDETLKAHAIYALRAVVRKLCPDKISGFFVSGVRHEWDGFVHPLIEQCKARLVGMESKESSIFLTAIAGASLNALRAVFSKVYPTLKDQAFNAGTSPTHRQQILEFFRDLVYAAYELLLTKQYHNDDDNPIIDHLASLEGLFMSCLHGGYEEQRVAALTGLTNILLFCAKIIEKNKSSNIMARESSCSDSSSSGSSLNVTMKSSQKKWNVGGDKERQERVKEKHNSNNDNKRCCSAETCISSITAALVSDDSKIVRVEALGLVIRLLLLQGDDHNDYHGNGGDEEEQREEEQVKGKDRVAAAAPCFIVELVRKITIGTLLKDAKIICTTTTTEEEEEQPNKNNLSSLYSFTPLDVKSVITPLEAMQSLGSIGAGVAAALASSTSSRKMDYRQGEVVVKIISIIIASLIRHAKTKITTMVANPHHPAAAAAAVTTKGRKTAQVLSPLIRGDIATTTTTTIAAEKMYFNQLSKSVSDILNSTHLHCHFPPINDNEDQDDDDDDGKNGGVRGDDKDIAVSFSSSAAAAGTAFKMISQASTELLVSMLKFLLSEGKEEEEQEEEEEEEKHVQEDLTRIAVAIVDFCTRESCDHVEPQTNLLDYILNCSAKLLSSLQLSSIRYVEKEARIAKKKVVAIVVTCRLLSRLMPELVAKHLNLCEKWFVPFLMKNNNYYSSCIDTRNQRTNYHYRQIEKEAVHAMMLCLASMINKAPPSSLKHFLGKWLNNAIDQLVKIATGNPDDEDIGGGGGGGGGDEERAVRAVEILSWMGKALAYRGDRVATPALKIIIDLLNDLITSSLNYSPHVTHAAAQGFGIMMADEGEWRFSDVYGVKMSKFYRQRIFLQNYTSLMASLATDSKSISGKSAGRQSVIKTNALLALSHLMQHAPTASVKPSLPKLIPHIMRALGSSSVSPSTSNDTDKMKTSLKISALFAVFKLLDRTMVHIDPYSDVLIDSCLQFTRFRSRKEVRIVALKCLKLLVNLPYHKLHRRKRQVVNELAEVLDDPKRVVRKVARECRNAWFMLKGNLTRL